MTFSPWPRDELLIDKPAFRRRIRFRNEPTSKLRLSHFLQQVAQWAKGLPKPTIIWDGSPVHRARLAQDKAVELGLELVFLPGYSPDLNPIEGLWKWMREEVTYAYCQPSLVTLFAACKKFIDDTNGNPQGMIDRLWPRFELDPDEEKLRVSA